MGWRVYNEQRDPSASGYVARPDGRQGYRKKMKRPADEVIRVQVLNGIVREEDFARVQHLLELKRRKHWRAGPGSRSDTRTHCCAWLNRLPIGSSLLETTGASSCGNYAQTFLFINIR
jgi:hypothetical protein